MNIKHIELHNFKTIKDFSSEFSGGIYLITGENETGKSTLLGAIATLLTGDRSANLLTKGEEKGFAKMTIGKGETSYEVELKYSEKNPRGNLSITASNGMKSDNKSMLNQIFQYQDFDAHEFVSWSQTAEGRRKQVELVKSLIPKEDQDRISDLELGITKAREERRDVSVQAKHFESLVNQKRVTDQEIEQYSKSIDPIELMNQKMKAADQNREIEAVQDRMNEREENLDGFNDETQKIDFELKQDITRMSEQLEEMRVHRKVYLNKREEERLDLLEKNKQATDWIKENPIIPTVDIDQQINEAESHNLKHAQVIEFDKASQDLGTKKTEEIKLTEEIKTKESEKADIIKNSAMPIEGLSFNENGLLLDGIEFAPGEVSTSQEMEIAAKLIIAKNPTVKVFKIAQGESLGADRLKAIVDFAKANGYQGFIEEVKRGQNELIIEEYTES